jgi:hypothetical protein
MIGDDCRGVPSRAVAMTVGRKHDPRIAPQLAAGCRLPAVKPGFAGAF